MLLCEAAGSTVLFLLLLALFSIMVAVIYFRKESRIKTLLELLQRSETKYNALLNVSHDLMFVFDSQYNFIEYLAERSSELFAEPSEFIGKNVYDVLPHDVAELTVKKIIHVEKTALMQIYDYQMDVNGERMFFNVRLDKFGSDKYLAVVRNITDRKKRNDETIRTHKLESLVLFAGGIANDFNNILSAILGSISLARLKMVNDEKAVTLLEEAEKAAQRGGRLTEQLLSFSMGGNTLRELAEIAPLVTESVNFTLSGSKTAAEFDIEPELPLVYVDKSQIGQVIQNIVLNASQSMPGGGIIKIIMRKRNFDEENQYMVEEGEYIEIEIADQGEGIDQKNMDRIFDPYFTTRSESSGLGLTICHGIVRGHGGAIAAESVSGSGSIFTVMLPVVKMETEIYKEVESDVKLNLKNLTIIILDDEPQLRFIMTELLKDEGAKIYTVPDGEEAIDIFEKLTGNNQNVDLIIADLTIPGGMGGMEAVRIMREQGVPFKAVVISGYSNDPVLSDYGSYGFDDFIAKPFNSEELLSVIKRVMAKQIRLS